MIQKECRLCGNLLGDTPDLDLGEQWPIQFVTKDFEGIVRSPTPLQMFVCSECKLVQTKFVAEPDELYRQYYYKSGLNESMRASLANVVTSAERYVDLQMGDVVVDIGANDGTLLHNYRGTIRKIGFEPASNLITCQPSGLLMVNDYFGADKYFEHTSQQAKIITACAMFYDVNDVHIFVDDVKKILDVGGVFVIQMNYLVSMLQNNDFSNMEVEHVTYWSLACLRRLFEEHEMEIYDAELNAVNGGSIRLYIGHAKKREPTERLIEIYAREDLFTEQQGGWINAIQQFEHRIQEIRRQVYGYIHALKNIDGEQVWAYGASTRGNTILQYFGLNSKIIPNVIDRDPDKIGKLMVGTNIQVIDENVFHSPGCPIKYILILPFHLLDNFRVRENEFLKNGGKMLVPLPEFQIYSGT